MNFVYFIKSISNERSNLLIDHLLFVIKFYQVSVVLSALNSLAAVATPPIAMISLLQQYSKLVMTQMSQGQFDEVSNFDTYKIISSVKSVVHSAVTISTPLTASEIFAGTKSNSFILATALGISNVKVGLILTRIATLTNKLGALVHSNPIIITLPDLSVCASAGCGFSLLTQTVDNTTYVNGSAIRQSFVSECKIGSLPIRIYSCANGLNVTASCDGKSVRNVTIKCPYIVTKPACGRLLSSSSSIVNDICSVSSYTNTETTCACIVPTATFLSSSRRLEEGQIRRELAISGMLEIGTITVKSIITSQAIRASPSLSPTFR